MPDYWDGDNLDIAEGTEVALTNGWRVVIEGYDMDDQGEYFWFSKDGEGYWAYSTDVDLEAPMTGPTTE
jgi:hypothetical protein